MTCKANIHQIVAAVLVKEVVVSCILDIWWLQKKMMVVLSNKWFVCTCQNPKRKGVNVRKERGVDPFVLCK